MSELNPSKTDHTLGEFPFPLSDGPKESAYLTWLRNHSNYMTARGFLDYLRSVGVLVRGIIVNFLIFLPYLLIVSIILGYAHHWILENPFRWSLGVLAIAVGWILLFPVLTPLFKIFSYKGTLESGSESSVNQRDLYERSFGGCLLAILAVAALESMPWMLEWFHELLNNEHFGWKESLATVVAALALLSGSDKLLSALSGAKQKVAMVFIGFLGLLVPLLVVLYATDYLVYGPLPSPLATYSPLVVPLIAVLALLVAIPIGLWRGAFSAKECAAVLGLFLTGFLLIAAVIVWQMPDSKNMFTKYTEDLEELIAPFDEVAAAVAKVSNKKDMEPEVVEFVDNVAAAHREYELQLKQTNDEADEFFGDLSKRYPQILHIMGDRETENVGGSISYFEKLSNAPIWLEVGTKMAEFTEPIFKGGQKFIALGSKISSLPPGSLAPLRRELAKLAHEKLLAKLGSEDDVPKLLRETLVRDNLRNLQVIESFPQSEEIKATKDVLRPANEWAKWDSKVKLTNLHNDLHKATTEGVNALQGSTINDIAKLVSEEELFHLVEERFSDVPGKAKLTRPAGKGELVKLVTKQELINHAFPQTALSVPHISAEETTRLVRRSVVATALSNLKWQSNQEVEKRWAAPDTERFPKAKTEAELTNAAEHKQWILRQQQESAWAATLAGLVDFKSHVSEPDQDVSESSKSPEERNPQDESDKQPSTNPPKAEPQVNDPVSAGRTEWEDEVSKGLSGAFTAEEIANIAAEELTKLAISDFNVKQLGLLALNYSIESFGDKGRTKWLSNESDLLKDKVVSKKELEEFQKQAEVASKLPLMELGKLPLEQLSVIAFSVHLPDAPMSQSSSSVERVSAVVVPNIYKVLLAYRVSMESRSKDVRQLAREQIVTEYLDRWIASDADRRVLRAELGGMKRGFTNPELASLEVRRILQSKNELFVSRVDDLVGELELGIHGRLDREKLRTVKRKLTEKIMGAKAILVFLMAAVIFCGWWLTVDVNLTSIHGLYRDRLASAFLVGQDTKGNVAIEQDLDLDELCRYEARSKAPYHLVNAALNLQGSQDVGIRDRNSDFFIFSKRFIGGQRTGYCRSEIMEQVFPQMSLATAMAISAAAASPNMGRGTSPLLVAFMTLLNIRLGFWMPNPGLLEEQLNRPRWKSRKKDPKRTNDPLGFTFEQVFAQELRDIQRRWGQAYSDDALRDQRHIMTAKPDARPTTAHGLVGIGFSGGGIRSASMNLGIAQTLHRFGIFNHVDYMSTVSGGGYLGSSISTLMRSRESLVSQIEGTVKIETGKLFSEIAGTVTIKREKSNSEIAENEKDDPNEYDKIVVVTPREPNEKPREYRFSCDADLAVDVGEQIAKGDLLIEHRNVTIIPSEGGEPRKYQFSVDAMLNVRDRENVGIGKKLLKPRATKNQSEITGTVSVERKVKEREQIVRIQGVQREEHREHTFSMFDRLVVKTGDTVTAGQELIERHNTISERFRWRVRPVAFLWEMLSKLDEKQRWVNLSDGGHIENLAAIELLRRRCKYIIIGDGEADPDHSFNGVATLMRCAYIDFGIEIQINLDAVRLKCAENEKTKPTQCEKHWAIGQITYPKRNENDEKEQPEIGYLLYLKSSFTDDEDEVIQEYRHRNPTFPHQTTADQFFDEGQFEAYRALGQRIAEDAIEALIGGLTVKDKLTSFKEFEERFKETWANAEKAEKKRNDTEKKAKTER